MTKIKVSYHSQKELEDVLKLLGPTVRKSKISKSQKGKYKKCYIDLVDLRNVKISR